MDADKCLHPFLLSNSIQVMLRSFVLVILMLVCGYKNFAQVILNGDGTAFTTKYCWEDKNYKIIGQPAGGVFSGCGVFQQGGAWFFNPVTASHSTTVFPFQCFITYKVNNISVNEPVLVAKPVLFVPVADSFTCTGNFYLHEKMVYAGDYNYAWTPSTYLDQPNTNSTAGHITHTQAFVITAIDQASGCSGKDTVTITYNQLQKLEISNDTTVLPRASVPLFVSGASSYVWSPTQWLDNPFSATPVATPHDAITYTVTGMDEHGCTASAQVSIGLYEGLYFPNAFTPNGDGLNDVFKIINVGYQSIQEFRICNRWGQTVFTTHDPTQGWDGNFNGHPAETGTYYYIIGLGMTDGTQKIVKGDLTLIR